MSLEAQEFQILIKHSLSFSFLFLFVLLVLYLKKKYCLIQSYKDLHLFFLIRKKSKKYKKF